MGKANAFTITQLPYRIIEYQLMIKQLPPITKNLLIINIICFWRSWWASSVA